MNMNMKPLSKAISSPGRPDKYPPPAPLMMRFLRTNVSSRSRRSRSSPMFVRKNKNAAAAAIDSQEPSSPKVTCMGQVRVRRSSKHRNRTSDADSAGFRRRRWWLRQPLSSSSSSCCCNFHRDWSNCGFFHILCFQSKRRTKVREDSSSATQLDDMYSKNNNVELKTTRHRVDYELDDEEDEEEGFQQRPNLIMNQNEDVHASIAPPKNALLLTRCRSAPYRSSSLASRFWGSPLKNSEETEEAEKTEMKNEEQEKPLESVVADDAKEDAKACGFLKELEDSVRERIVKSENAGDLKREDGGGDSSRPLILTRCKSEPARTSQKLDPDFNFWKKRRLGLPHY